MFVDVILVQVRLISGAIQMFFDGFEIIQYSANTVTRLVQVTPPPPQHPDLTASLFYKPYGQVYSI